MRTQLNRRACYAVINVLDTALADRSIEADTEFDEDENFFILLNEERIALGNADTALQNMLTYLACVGLPLLSHDTLVEEQESVSGQPQLKLTSVSELEKFAEETTGKPADSLLNYWLNKSWFECWLLGNGLNTQYYVDINSLPGELDITNILRRHDSENVVIMDLGTSLEEGLSRLIAYLSGAIESGWYFLTDYDAEAEADPEFVVDKQWLEQLQTERELLDLMVARQEKDQLDSDKHEIYNALYYLWEVMNERFTVETAYDLLVNKDKLCVHLGIGIYLESLVMEVAKDVLSVVQPHWQATPSQQQNNTTL